MTDQTKTVLGRVFTWCDTFNEWQAATKYGTITISKCASGIQWNFRAYLERVFCEKETWCIASGYGDTESDAILALQATLRKMAELEVTQ